MDSYVQKNGFGLLSHTVLSFVKRTQWTWQTPFSNNTTDNSTYGRHQMISTEIRLIMFFAPEDGETIKSAKLRPGVDCSSDYSSLLQNLDLN